MTTTTALDMQSATVADIAIQFPQSLGILNRYNLDYCCNGGKSFVAACTKLKLDAASIWNEITTSTQMAGSDQRRNFGTWQTPLLIDYIVQNHHGYVREAAPRISELLKKVEAAHSDDHPEVIRVRQVFAQLSEELMDHMTVEEVIVFPAIRSNDEKEEAAGSCSIPTNIDGPVLVMQTEHEEAGRLVKQIRTLTQNYTPPLYACPTFQMTWRLLKEFDNDLMEHIHLENNILFPRAAK